MKRSSNRLGVRLWKTRLALAVGCALLSLPAPAQTAGQQVSPQPLGSEPAGQASPATGMGDANGLGGLGSYGQQQQAPSAPMTLPGVQQPSTADRTGMFGTGVDIPQISPNTQIDVGDLLDIVIFETPELSGRFRVNSKGDVLLPLAGSLHVAGLNLSEITDAVTQRYIDAKLLVHPQITVFVSEFVGRNITVSGEVRRPGIYPITGPRTLTDIMALSGGLNDNAARTISIVHAADPNQIIHITLNVGPQTEQSIADGRTPILPGDSIFIARSGLVYLVGDLQRAGAFQVEHNNRLTLLEALALAGGPTRTSNLSSSRLIRRSETGREELKVDLKKVLYGGGPDMLLTDGDILFVPTSLKRQYAFSALDATIGTATSYAIYRLAQY